MKNRESGFTLFELMIVFAIIAILSAIAAPNFIVWRDNSNLRGSAFNLKSDLEMAKMRAIKGGGDVIVNFTTSGYDISQPGGAINIASKDLTNIEVKTIPATYQAVFNSRGRANNSGSIILSNKNMSITVSVNLIGLISIE